MYEVELGGRACSLMEGTKLGSLFRFSPFIAYPPRVLEQLQARVLGPSSSHQQACLLLRPHARTDRIGHDKTTYTDPRDHPRIVLLPTMTWISKAITTFGLVLVAHA